MTNVTATAIGGVNSYGVYNFGASPTMSGIIATASGASDNNYGVFNQASSLTISNSALRGSTAGLYNNVGDDTFSVLVQNSQVTGVNFAAYNDSGVTLKIGGSYLNGGPVGGAGTKVCAGNYDENYAFFPSTCP
jgi:hypothetical protein